MKLLNVQFSEVQILKIKDAGEVLGVTNSKIARAAMLLGMQKIADTAEKDASKAKELVLINDTKSKF
jgi:hypothetical protein